MKILVLGYSGQARQVFKLISLLAKERGNQTLGQIVKEVKQ